MKLSHKVPFFLNLILSASTMAGTLELVLDPAAAKAENEGRSFVPLLKNPKMEWNHPTLTTGVPALHLIVLITSTATCG